jgi:hypothetical protein
LHRNADIFLSPAKLADNSARQKKRGNCMTNTSKKTITLYPAHDSRDFREFSQIVQQRLDETGLIEFLDDAESGCVENGSKFFVELVLQDGSLIEQGEGLILDLAGTFPREHEHVRVQGVVRAHWTVGSIIHVGLCRDESGLLRNAECYKVELVSGRGRQIVEVEVLPSAFEEIARSLGAGEQFVQQVIRQLLEHDLKKGGLSYWHQIRHPKQHINQMAALAMIYEINNPE